MDSAISGFDQPVKRGPGRPRKRPLGVLEADPRMPQGTGSKRDYSGITSAERVMLAKAELIELELAERKGRLIDRKALLSALQGRNARFRARMLGIPSKWAAQFAPPSKLRQAEDALRRAIEEALSELAGME